MAGKLDRYRSKRDFAQTPEPAGDSAAWGDEQRYVIHQHDATNLHWDLRLERNGVLASWALPKGIPDDPSQNRLAVHTEDHPLEYIDFHGEIPKGSYGAGTMTIWDAGTYETEKWRKDEIIITLHGEKLSGRYVLFQTGGKNWMIHRMDPAVDPTAEPPPESITPMLAKLAKLPRDDDRYAFEIKWDGVRAIMYCDAGHSRLQSRTLRDISAEYPELKALGRALGMSRIVLDGEIVAFDDEGRPNFGRLQRRMHLASEAAVRRRMKDTPVTYMVFDLLYLNGHSTVKLPYSDRRRLLEALELDGPCWKTPASHVGDGAAMLAASAEQQLEGVVAKRLDSVYEPGGRSGAWLKIKNHRRQELVVGGWLPGQGARSKSLGSLAVGYYENGSLRYAGNVGSGFTDSVLRELTGTLAPLAIESSPFDGRQPPKQTTFVRPELVVEVEFGEWTAAKTLRHPIFKGIRDDKPAQDVVLEAEEPAGDTD